MNRPVCILNVSAPADRELFQLATLRQAETGVMPFRDSKTESQRGSGSKPRVARKLPWEIAPQSDNLEGVAAWRHKRGTTPLGLKSLSQTTQGCFLFPLDVFAGHELGSSSQLWRRTERRLAAGLGRTSIGPCSIIHNLCDIASKGGNYLLNVGPTSEGLIPQPSVDRLAEVGAGMKVNGEAIYGSGPTPFGAEAGTFSATEKDKSGEPKFTPAWEWRATTQPGKKDQTIQMVAPK